MLDEDAGAVRAGRSGVVACLVARLGLVGGAGLLEHGVPGHLLLKVLDDGLAYGRPLDEDAIVACRGNRPGDKSSAEGDRVVLAASYDVDGRPRRKSQVLDILLLDSRASLPERIRGGGDGVEG